MLFLLLKAGEKMSDGKIIIDTDVDSGGATQGLSKLSNIVNSSLKGIAASRGSVRKMRISHVKSIFPADTNGLQTF